MSSLRIQYSPLTIHSDSDGVMQIEAIARHSGVLKYRSDSGDRYELVPDDLILAKDSEDKPVMGWIAGAPATNEHPIAAIRFDESARKAYQVGTVADDVHIYKDSNGVRKVKVRIDVADPVTQQEIRDGKKKGVSMGYMCGVKEDSGEWNGQKYTHVQEMPLKIDHLAIVANPRAPEALITRFDSDDISDSDVAWAVAEEEPVVTPSMRIIHVDACCAACEAAEKSDEEKPGIKKKATKPKKDSDEQMTTAVMERSDTETPVESVTHIKFSEGMVAVPDRLLNSLHADGIIEVVELAGEEFLVGADFANQLRADGLIEHEDFLGAIAGAFSKKKKPGQQGQSKACPGGYKIPADKECRGKSNKAVGTGRMPGLQKRPGSVSSVGKPMPGMKITQKYYKNRDSEDWRDDANCNKAYGWYPGPGGKCTRPPKGANTSAGAKKAAAGAASLKKFGQSNLNAQNAARLAELRKKKSGAAKAISGNVTGGSVKAGAIAKSAKGIQAAKTRATQKARDQARAKQMAANQKRAATIAAKKAASA